MDKKNELPPTCLLAYLPTCSLYLLCFFTPIPPRPHRILVPSGDTQGGTVFLIRPSHPPGPYPSRPAPFLSAHSFLHLVMPSRPIVSSGVCNEIFCYLTFHMLNTKKTMLNRKPTARPRRLGNTNTSNRKNAARQRLINLSFAHPPTQRAGDYMRHASKREARRRGSGDIR